jgi:hypothetical protein
MFEEVTPDAFFYDISESAGKYGRKYRQFRRRHIPGE